jgi:hypothetical protein
MAAAGIVMIGLVLGAIIHHVNGTVDLVGLRADACDIFCHVRACYFCF